MPPAKKAAPADKAPADRKPKPDHWRPAPAGGRYYGGSSTPAKPGNTSRKTRGGPAAAKKAAPAKKTAAKSGVKKAAAAEVAGGGPEDPLADLAAAGALKGDSHHKTPIKAHGALRAGNPRRLVLAEFLVCLVVLGLGTIVAPSNRPNGGASHLAVKGSALALLFFILALMTGGGEKAKKAAEGLGALITIAYLFTSQDAASVVTWISGFFSAKGSGVQGAGGAVAGGVAAAGAGASVAAGVEGAAQ